MLRLKKENVETKTQKYKIKSLTFDWISPNTNSIAQSKSLFTCCALIIEPIIAIFKNTFTINKVVFI